MSGRRRTHEREQEFAVAMMDRLEMPADDKILKLSIMFNGDDRPGKIDLGIGVYRNARGETPIFAAVRQAEEKLFAQETTKTYVTPAGDPGFCAAIQSLVFGDDAPDERIRTVQTPGGAGALNILAELANLASPGVTVHVPIPTWINHHAVITEAGLGLREYRYLDPRTGQVDFDGMMDQLGNAEPGDIVLLQGCCHNPTGADLGLEQWQAVAALLEARGLLPFVDLAYQGFGDGLEEDAASVRLLAGRLPEMIVAYSCSKNFGIYRERTGAAFVLAPTPALADRAAAQLARLARITYSMPPDHGASLVRIILNDPALRQIWKDELEAMRTGVTALRRELASAFHQITNRSGHEFLTDQKGMFSLIGISADQAVRLREEFAIYIVEDGRINIAGLRGDQVMPFAKAICAV
jgi:aromatic-amino-acid transaminase